MAVEALTGSWAANEAAHEGFHQVGTYVRNETVAGATLNSSWQLIRGVLPARAAGRFLQLQLQNGSGSLYIDNTFIGANMTGHDSWSMRDSVRTSEVTTLEHHSVVAGKT